MNTDYRVKQTNFVGNRSALLSPLILKLKNLTQHNNHQTCEIHMKFWFINDKMYLVQSMPSLWECQWLDRLICISIDNNNFDPKKIHHVHVGTYRRREWNKNHYRKGKKYYSSSVRQNHEYNSITHCPFTCAISSALTSLYGYNTKKKTCYTLYNF